MALLDRYFPHDPGCARYLPAVSANYAEIAVDPTYSVSGFAGLDLNYLNPHSRFHYPMTLISAGQSAKTAVRASQSNMISQRNPHTFVIADSGGYQIQEGTMRYEGESTIDNVMQWASPRSDWMMALDFPTGGIEKGRIEPYRVELERQGISIRGMCSMNGLESDYNAARLLTERCTSYMVQNRDTNGAKILVVLQGRSENESADWYQSMRPYIDEGVSFAGGTVRGLSLMLNRILDMRDNGELKRIKLIHVLGVSTLQCAVIYTALQRSINTYEGLDIQITYDSSSPFTNAYKFYKAYTYYFFEHANMPIRHMRPIDFADEMKGYTLNDWAYELTRRFNHKQFEDGSNMAYYARSTIGERIKINDLIDWHQGRWENNANAFHLVARHNVEVHTLANQLAIQTFYAHARLGGAIRDAFRPRIASDVVSIIDLIFDRTKSRSNERSLISDCVKFLNVDV
jgi:hypothetical protein